MELNVNKFFGDRLVFDPKADGCLRAFDRQLDASHSEAQGKSAAAFRQYLVDALGSERLQRIAARYDLSLEGLFAAGPILDSRKVAQIVVGSRIVSVQDIDEYLRDHPDVYSGKRHIAQLTAEELFRLYKQLSKILPWEVPSIRSEITGAPTEWSAAFFHDQFLADREKLEIFKENPTDVMQVFIHNMVARGIKREMSVGELIPAPNHPLTQQVQFYFVCAKIVTGDGVVSYIIRPATNDTNLEAMRLFRGTSPRASDLDALSSVITDLELQLGKRAYESASAYEPFLQTMGLAPSVEAGHSLGATTIQYRLAHFDHIRKAYLYCGPGVPFAVVKQFNEKNRPLEIYISHSEHDPLSRLGGVHLGYHAPSAVQVNFWKYHGPSRRKINHHVVVWPRSKYYYGIRGGLMHEGHHRELYNRYNLREILRVIFGPVLALVLRVVRFVIRTLFQTRAMAQQGVQYGAIFRGRWRVAHYRLTRDL